jgi:hypothetical protein
MQVTFADIVKDAAGISAIVASLTFLVGVATLIKSVTEYSKQNSLKRFEKYESLSKNWIEDDDIQEIVALLQSGQGQKLRGFSIRKKEEFVGFFEEIALMVDSRLLKKKIAYYMFGYYTILCDESEDFWHDLEKSEHFWSLFRRFTSEMKRIRADINLRKENPDQWKFKF